MSDSEQKRGLLWRQREEARRLGKRALISLGGTAVAWWVLGALPWVGSFLGPAAGVIGLGITAYNTWKWLSYRAKWGLKF